jgi:hypothetical protein
MLFHLAAASSAWSSSSKSGVAVVFDLVDIVERIFGMGGFLPQLLAQLLLQPHRPARHVQHGLLLIGAIQVDNISGRLLGVEGLPRGDLRCEVVVRKCSYAISLSLA